MPEKRNWRKILPVGILLAAALAVGITSATILHAVTLENPIKTPTVEGHIDEVTEGHEVKIVKFVNDGSADVFLRVSYVEGWVYDPTPDTPGDEVVLPNEAELADPEDGGPTKAAVAVPEWTDDWKNDWEKKDDGWYYYKKVLSAGVSTEEVVKKVVFPKVVYKRDPESSVEVTDQDGRIQLEDYRFKDTRYAFAQYNLTFTMEIVQASDEKQVSIDAVKELFHLDPSNALPESSGVEDDPNKWDKNGSIDWTKATVVQTETTEAEEGGSQS